MCKCVATNTPTAPAIRCRCLESTSARKSATKMVACNSYWLNCKKLGSKPKPLDSVSILALTTLTPKIFFKKIILKDMPYRWSRFTSWVIVWVILRSRCFMWITRHSTIKATRWAKDCPTPLSTALCTIALSCKFHCYTVKSTTNSRKCSPYSISTEKPDSIAKCSPSKKTFTPTIATWCMC